MVAELNDNEQPATPIQAPSDETPLGLSDRLRANLVGETPLRTHRLKPNPTQNPETTSAASRLGADRSGYKRR